MRAGTSKIQFELPQRYFHEVCRVCLLNSKLLIPIEQVNFTHRLTPNGQKETVSLCKVLSDFCKVEVFPSDGKPQHICEFCINMSSQAFNFFQLFLASNRFLETCYPHLQAHLNKLSPEKEIPDLQPPLEKQLEPEPQILIDTNSVIDPVCSESFEQNTSVVDNVTVSNELSEEQVVANVVIEEHDYCGSAEQRPKKSFFDFMFDLEVDFTTMNLPKSHLWKLQREEMKKDIYTCQHCNIRICGIEKMIEHDLDSHRVHSRCIQCGLCLKVLLGIRSYKYHMRSHSDKVLVCDFCREYFPNIDAYNAHNAAIDHENHTCKLCNKKFETTNPKRRDVFHALKLHVEVNHCATERGTCDVCGKAFKHVANLKRHIRSVHYKEKFICHHCAKPMQTKCDLTVHVERHHPEEVGTDLKAKFPHWFFKNKRGSPVIRCPQCSLSFFSTNMFYHHCDQAHRCFSNYCCQICPEEFTTLQDLKKHQTVHPQYKCSRCGSSFIFSSDLLHHRMRCYYSVACKQQQRARKHFYTSTVIQCQYCPNKSRSTYGLYRHSTVHSEFVDYACEACDNKYENYTDLNWHNKLDHKDLCCTQCDLFFPTKGKLTLHKHAKHGARKVQEKSQCHICGEMILGPKSMKSAHIENMHAGVRPYVCEICGKGFRQDAHLRVHKYQHNAEKMKPWKCRLCPKSFSFASILRSHIRTHTGEKPFKCLYCAKMFGAPITRHKHIMKNHPERKVEYLQLKADGVLRQEVKYLEGVREGALYKLTNSGEAVSEETRGVDGFEETNSRESDEEYTAEESEQEEGQDDDIDGYS